MRPKTIDEERTSLYLDGLKAKLKEVRSDYDEAFEDYLVAAERKDRLKRQIASLETEINLYQQGQLVMGDLT